MFDSKNRAAIDAISRIRQNRLGDEQTQQPTAPQISQSQKTENTQESSENLPERIKSGLISTQNQQPNSSIHGSIPSFQGYLPPGKSIGTDVNSLNRFSRIFNGMETSTQPGNNQQEPKYGRDFRGRPRFPRATPETEKKAMEFNARQPRLSLIRMNPDGTIVN
jgi:hypothetical protein